MSVVVPVCPELFRALSFSYIVRMHSECYSKSAGSTMVHVFQIHEYSSALYFLRTTEVSVFLSFARVSYRSHTIAPRWTPDRNDKQRYIRLRDLRSFLRLILNKRLCLVWSVVVRSFSRIALLSPFSFINSARTWNRSWYRDQLTYLNKM